MTLEILYVEDDALVRELTLELLSDGSRAVVAVATGEEALSVLSEKRFDLVVTDISLPAMSGVELARQVAANYPSLPIILASGYLLDPKDCGLGAQVRAIAKPFTTLTFDQLVQELCTSPGAS